jgi:diacylglycerol kinase
MTNLQELIDTSKKLCAGLEKAAQEETRFSYDLQIAIEKMAWECFCHANDLEAIQLYIS